MYSNSCDGANSAVVETRSCAISYSELRAEPFNLVLGDEIIFVVKAKNEIGWSSYSVSPSIKDVIRTEPISPLTTVEEGIDTDDS